MTEHTTISSCYLTGTVTAHSYTGGIAGTTYTTTISSCYSTGTVTADKFPGGIAGSTNTTTISSCYSTGTVTADDNAGGIAGIVNSSTISYCYFTGEVSALSKQGAIVGEIDAAINVTSCYVSSDFYAASLINNGAAPKTTSEMTLYGNSGTDPANIYTGWDFYDASTNPTGLWAVDETNGGYPYLKELAAEYGTNTLTIDADGGTVDQGQSAAFNINGTVDIAVTPPAGYTFSGWTITSDDGLPDNPGSITNNSNPGEFTGGAGDAAVTASYNKLPYYTESPYSREIAEDASTGNNVGIPVTATDDDGTISSYLITACTDGGGNPVTLPGDAVFAIDNSGQITVADDSKLDEETTAYSSYVLTVQATDNKGGTGTAAVSIEVTNVDEDPVIDEPEMSNIPGVVPPGEDDGSGGGTNPPVTIFYEDETITYYFNGYDPEGNTLYFIWRKNGQTVSSENTYTFVPEPLKDGEKSREYTMTFIADDGTGKGQLSAQWKIMVINADNPINVNSVLPAPNTSTDPSISTAGGSYNMTEGETLNFSVDADDADGSLLWRNWYVNDELVWLNADFDFSTHFMSSGGSPYDIKLYLQGQQGDYQEFHWTVNVSNKEAVTYANAPMLLNGTAMIEGLNAESGDAIAAYSGNELRGEILLNGSNFDNFTVNLSENNEEISFVIYDSDNNIIKTVHRTINGDFGTSQNIVFHGYEEVSNSIILGQDWNYVSFNTIPEDNSVSSVFTNMNVSQIQTVDEVYSSSNPEFLNTLKEINPGIGYLVKMNSNSSMFVNGYSAENSEIQLYEGWNLIGYTERSSADIETAFGSIMDKIIEIKSEASVYSSDMPSYMNTLSYIEENKAYWVKCSEDCVLDFPIVENKENYNKLNGINHLGTGSSYYAVSRESTLNTYSTSPTRPPVDVSFGNIAVRTNSFVVYAEIKNPMDNTLYAYAGNELRGISQIVVNNNRYYTSIVVNSDIAGEEITLKIRDNTIKTISSIPGTTIGKDNLLLLDGSLENEIPASFKVSLFPNPFNPEINISFELPKAERINISVFDINGKLVKTLEDNVFNSGKHSITWNGTDSNNNKMASGIYFVKVKSDSYNTTEKIVMMK